MSLVIAVFDQLEPAEHLYTTLIEQGYLREDVAIWQGKEEVLSLSDDVAETVAEESMAQEPLPIDTINHSMTQILESIHLDLAAHGTIVVGLRTEGYDVDRAKELMRKHGASKVDVL
ncbi:MAG TPA: hypothetical protein GXX57_00070 [Firmicutes bacterium]|nr:hypothetical protein [Bacillota bacterium]